MARKKPEPEVIPPEPWECQEGETPRPYEAFCVYRDMGPERSVRKVARKLGKSETLIARWSSENDWVKRVAAWDMEQDRIARQAQLKDIVEMRKRHAEISMKALDKVAEAIDNINPEEMSNQDIARLVGEFSKLERLARGDVGDVIEERDGGEAINPVQIYIPSNGRERDKQNYDDLEV